jgi:hypothetical protein
MSWMEMAMSKILRLPDLRSRRSTPPSRAILSFCITLQAQLGKSASGSIDRPPPRRWRIVIVIELPLLRTLSGLSLAHRAGIRRYGKRRPRVISGTARRADRGRQGGYDMAIRPVASRHLRIALAVLVFRR